MPLPDDVPRSPALLDCAVALSGPPTEDLIFVFGSAIVNGSSFTRAAGQSSQLSRYACLWCVTLARKHPQGLRLQATSLVMCYKWLRSDLDRHLLGLSSQQSNATAGPFSFSRSSCIDMMMAHAAPQHAPVGFGKQGASYAKFRPDYPQDLYNLILAPSKPTERRLAIDVATGSGQAARGLSAHFERVVALDLDPEQLQHASSTPNVTFKVAAAEKLGVEDSCADLVAVAAGLHW